MNYLLNTAYMIYMYPHGVEKWIWLHLHSLNLAKPKSLIKSFTYVLYQQRARHKNIQKTFIRSFFVQKSSWHTLTSETNLSHDTPPTHSYPTSEQIVRFYFFYFFYSSNYVTHKCFPIRTLLDVFKLKSPKCSDLPSSVIFATLPRFSFT